MRFRFPVRSDTLREDAVAGLVLGVESVPDGLAAGLLAGVNPLAGLYGSALRFVSNAVMVGFISAVGVNIILGQLTNLTGYKAEGANRTCSPSR